MFMLVVLMCGFHVNYYGVLSFRSIHTRNLRKASVINLIENVQNTIVITLGELFLWLPGKTSHTLVGKFSLICYILQLLSSRIAVYFSLCRIILLKKIQFHGQVKKYLQLSLVIKAKCSENRKI